MFREFIVEILRDLWKKENEGGGEKKSEKQLKTRLGWARKRWNDVRDGKKKKYFPRLLHFTIYSMVYSDEKLGFAIQTVPIAITGWILGFAGCAVAWGFMGGLVGSVLIFGLILILGFIIRKILGVISEKKLIKFVEKSMDYNLEKKEYQACRSTLFDALNDYCKNTKNWGWYIARQRVRIRQAILKDIKNGTASDTTMEHTQLKSRKNELALINECWRLDTSKKTNVFYKQELELTKEIYDLKENAVKLLEGENKGEQKVSDNESLEDENGDEKSEEMGAQEINELKERLEALEGKLSQNDSMLKKSYRIWKNDQDGQSKIPRLNEEYGYFIAHAHMTFPDSGYEDSQQNMKLHMADILNEKGKDYFLSGDYTQAERGDYAQAVKDCNSFREGKLPYEDIVLSTGVLKGDVLYDSILKFAKAERIDERPNWRKWSDAFRWHEEFLDERFEFQKEMKKMFSRKNIEPDTATLVEFYNTLPRNLDSFQHIDKNRRTGV